MTIRVLLADDQALLRGTFRLLIAAQPDMEVVGEASNGREAVRLARSERADVVVMDIRMPEVDGIEATRLIGQDEDLAGVRVQPSRRARAMLRPRGRPGTEQHAARVVRAGGVAAVHHVSRALEGVSGWFG